MTTPPPAPYRAPDLAAECERLRAENAGLRAEPARVPMRWTVLMSDVSDPPIMLLAAMTVLSAAAWWAWYFVADGWTPMVARFAAVVAVAVALWALAFVRRVPAEGSTR